jgi:glycosyltransferase involved in cell wall biosynthesis
LFLALTNFAKGRFVAGGLPESKLRVKANFVDDPGGRFRRPSESNVILCVGRLSDEKGIPVLLEAWSRLGKSDMELVLVGDGPLRASLGSADLPNVQILGSQPSEEVRRLMLGARALVFPSVSYEGQPMVLLEALAAGLPMAVSNIAGIPGTIGNSQAARWAIPGDVETWATALSGLDDDAWVDSAGAAGRAVFEDRYTPAIGLAALQATYARTMGASG